MAETLGMLCDKLTIVKLKEYHADSEEKSASLRSQALQLQQEIDEYIADAINGAIPSERMTFAANKVFKQQGNEIKNVEGAFGEIFYKLANVNCELWHEQDKVYDYESVQAE